MASQPSDILIDVKHSPTLRSPRSQFVYFPAYALSFAARTRSVPSDLQASPALLLASNKTKFCAFLYSHDVDYRVAFFHQLSRCGR